MSTKPEGGNAIPKAGRPADDEESYSYSYSMSDADGDGDQRPVQVGSANQAKNPPNSKTVGKSQVYADRAFNPSAAAAKQSGGGAGAVYSNYREVNDNNQGEEEAEANNNDNGGKKGKKKRRMQIANGLNGMRTMMDNNKVVAFISGSDAQRIAIYFFFFFSFFYLLFTILSSSLSQLDEVGGGCYTYWGYKASCGSISYTVRPPLMACVPLRRSLQAASAFSIFTILTAAAMCGMGWILCIRLRKETRAHNKLALLRGGADGSDEEMEHLNGNNNNKEGGKHYKIKPFNAGFFKWVCVIVTAVSLVCNLICWAIMAGVYGARHCEDKNMPRTLAYGVGFGLSLTAWIFSLLILVVFSVIV